MILGLNHSSVTLYPTWFCPAPSTSSLQGTCASRRPVQNFLHLTPALCALLRFLRHSSSVFLEHDLTFGKQIVSYAARDLVRASGAEQVPCCIWELRYSHREAQYLFSNPHPVQVGDAECFCGAGIAFSEVVFFTLKCPLK